LRRILVAGLSIAAIACTARPDSAAVVDADASWFLADSTCMFEARVAHPEARPLVEEFVSLARVGTFGRSEDWLPLAHACIGHEPGYDVFFVLDSVRLEFTRTTSDSVFALLHSWQVGFWTDTLVRDAQPRTDSIVALRTPYGWRLERPFWNWIDVSEAKRLGVVPATPER